jgi:hypothetical protein
MVNTTLGKGGRVCPIITIVHHRIIIINKIALLSCAIIKLSIKTP